MTLSAPTPPLTKGGRGGICSEPPAKYKPISKTPLDQQYELLKASPPAELDRLLSALDPRNSLELDMVRQFLSGLAPEVLAAHSHLQNLSEIISSAAKHPRVSLGEIISLRREVLPLDEYNGEIDILGKIRFSDGKLFLREERQAGTNLQYSEKGDLIVSKINFHQAATTVNDFGKLLTSMDYLVYKVDAEIADARFICHIVRSKQFLKGLTENKPGGVKGRSQPDFIETLEIPLPPIAEQQSIVAEIDRQLAIMAGAEMITSNLKLQIGIGSENLEPIGKAVIETKNGWSPRCEGGDTPVLSLACLKNGSIDLTEVKYTSLTRHDIGRFFVEKGDFFYGRGNTPELVAMAGIARDVTDKVVFSDLLTRVKFDETLILPEFAVYLFNSKLGRQYFGSVPVGASPSMVKVSQDYMAGFMVPLLGDISKQTEIVTSLSTHNALITSISELKLNAVKTCTELINAIWEH